MMRRRRSGELTVSGRSNSFAAPKTRTGTPQKNESVVLFARTGRVRDSEERAVRAWALSKRCDFRNGAKLAVLCGSATAHNDETGGERFEISTRALGSLLRKLAKEEPERFHDTMAGWKCAPPLSYLVSTSLPPNKVLANRDDVKKGKKAVLLVVTKKKQQQALSRAAKGIAAKRQKRAAKGGVVGSGQGKKRSVLFEQAFVEAKALCPTISTRALPLVAAHLVAGYAAEFGLDHIMTPEAISEITPSKSALGAWIDRRGEFDDLTFEKMTADVQAVYAQFDAGNKGGREWLWQVFSFWNPTEKCVCRWYADAMVTGKLGDEVADEVFECAKSRNVSLLGSTTDSASNVINGVVTSLREGKVGKRESIKSFVAAGCLLHILNLVLMNGFVGAYGDETMNVVSPLRVGYMVAYLVGKFSEEFREWCLKNGHEDAYLPAQAWKGRWWSVMRSFNDIERGRELYCKFFCHMANSLDTTSSYQPLFKDVAAWLKNPVCRASMLFVSAFCEAFWNDEFTYCQDIDDNMAHLPARQRMAGHRAHRYTRKAVRQYDGLIIF
jgi:hypothetical protein